MTNNQLKRTLEFDLADAPALMAAMRLSAATAMMCGHKGAEAKLRQYQAVFKALIPPEASYFDEEVWCEIGNALLTASKLRVTIEPVRWERDRGWWYSGELAVYVDDRRFESSLNYTARAKRGDDTLPQAVCVALKELAPLDCECVWDSAEKVR